MGLLCKFLPLLAAVAAANAALLSLESPKITISSSDATQLRSEPLPLVEKPTPLILGQSDTLKLTFQVIEKDEGKGVQPHQTFLRFYDETTGEEGIQPVKVTQGGRAKFELNMARPPSSLPPTSEAPLKVSLLLGSYVHSPAKYELFDLYVPASHPAPQHPDAVTFHPRPPIAHTFRPEQKVPPKFISFVFAGLVITPWALLLGLWSQIQIRVPHIASPHVVPFTGLLGAFEVLLIWYWVDLKLGQILAYGAVLGFFTVLAGKHALGSTGDWRTGRK